MNPVPQKQVESKQPDPFLLSNEHQLPKQTSFTLSNATRDSFRNLCSMKAKNLLPPLVQKGYHLTKDDLSFLDSNGLTG